MTATTNRPYLVFGLGGESYAVPVERAAEVIESAKVTRLPASGQSYQGIINLRGKGIPLVDLRSELGLVSSVPEALSPIIVLELPAGDGSSRLVGARVDSVREVLELDDSSLEAVPRFGSGGSLDCVSGIVRLDSDFVLILDPSKLLDQALLERIDAGAAPEALGTCGSARERDGPSA